MKNENGEVMLESLIMYSVTIFLLFFILAIFSVLFQRWNIQTIANESATRVAQTYNLGRTPTDFIEYYRAQRDPEYLWSVIPNVEEKPDNAWHRMPNTFTGGKAVVLYNPENPQEAYLRDNVGIMNC